MNILINCGNYKVGSYDLLLNGLVVFFNISNLYQYNVIWDVQIIELVMVKFVELIY